MKLVFFANGGELGLLPLRTVAAHHELVAVVRPVRQGKRFSSRGWLRRSAEWLGVRPGDPVTEWTTRTGAHTIPSAAGEDQALATAIRRLAPDLICISTWPRLLSQEILAIPRFGALNLHPSLLPRHRGPAPYFWVYYSDDRETGVTVHLATRRADAGPIVCQERCELPRGLPVRELHSLSAQRGAELLLLATDRVTQNAAREQDDRQATPAPRVRPGTPMLRSDWPAERAWHFLAGLCPQYREPFRNERGAPVEYAAVPGFEVGSAQRPPGVIETTNDGWRLHCRDGYVRLARA